MTLVTAIPVVDAKATPGLRRRQEETRRARAPTGNATCEFDVKVCDRVLFGKWSGNEVKIDG